MKKFKINCNLGNHNTHQDWRFNLIPYFNFGNCLCHKKGIILNLGFGLWNLNVHIMFNYEEI